jgi:hypothetical protein
MSNAPPKRSLPAWSEKPSADFNWPPTDDPLAQYHSEAGHSETIFDETGVETAEPSVAPPSPASAPPASSEPRYAAFDWPPVESPTRSDVEDPTPSGIENSATSGIAVAQSETALDGTSAGGLAAEIAHLQALIEGLTNFMGDEPRCK